MARTPAEVELAALKRELEHLPHRVDEKIQGKEVGTVVADLLQDAILQAEAERYIVEHP
jgi:hypothetical protein